MIKINLRFHRRVIIVPWTLVKNHKTSFFTIKMIFSIIDKFLITKMTISPIKTIVLKVLSIKM